MLPESSSVVFRPDLAAVAQEYNTRQAAARFIAGRAAPIFKSPNCSAAYPIFRRSNFKKRVSVNRAADGSYNRIQGIFGKGTYDCDDHGLEYPIDRKRRAQYATLFDAEVAGTTITQFQLLLNWEYRVSTLYANGGHTNHNVTTAWSTSATAVPLTDIQAGMDALKDKCGASQADMGLIVPQADFRELNACAQVRDSIKYNYPGLTPAQLAAAQLATILQIGQVLIADAVVDSKEEGVAETESHLWTAGVCYIAVLARENDPLEIPSAARTILWTGDADEIPVMESYPEERIRSDIIRGRDDTDEVLLGETDLLVYQLTNT